MASVSMFPSEHRKQAFASVTHSSWPTPPTENDHDFPQDTQDTSKSVSISAETGENSIQSPPASPVQWTNTLPPLLRSPPDTPASRKPLPSIDAPLFAMQSHEQSPLFSSPQASPEDRVSSSSEAQAEKGIYSIFPQFRGADREFFRKYRDSCYSELRKIPGWRPLNPRALQPIQTQPTTLQHSRRQAPALPAQKPKESLRTTAGPRAIAKPVHAKPKVAKINTSSPITRPLKATAKLRDRSSASAEPQARKRAAPTKLVVQDNWLEMQDYSPPTATLDNMSAKLHVLWKGPPNDYGNDPELKFLHDQEIEVAQALKLPARQYLANKRRIFEARLKSIRDRKNFTKTAAQQACNIDVNKTSQLYEAFEKVGWFDENHFRQWLV